jgi:hypothetical protein
VPPRIAMVGQRYGRWRVISFVRCQDHRTLWRCKCRCGTVREVRSDHLRNRLTKSCGCWKKEELAIRVSLAGQYSPKRRHHQLEATYSTMLQRCLNPSNQKYPDYGGRGIKVCARWLYGQGHLTGFDCFAADMGRKPSRAHSIDRYPDNDGNYTPKNCRWATKSQQTRNQRKRRKRKK